MTTVAKKPMSKLAAVSIALKEDWAMTPCRSRFRST